MEIVLVGNQEHEVSFSAEDNDYDIGYKAEFVQSMGQEAIVPVDI